METGKYLTVYCMKMRAILAVLSSLLAIASAIAYTLGFNAPAPMLLAVLAALCALASGFVRPASTIINAEPMKSAMDIPQPTIMEASTGTKAPPVVEVPCFPQKNIAAAANMRLRFADAVLTKVPLETEAAVNTLMERLIALRDESSQAADASSHADEGLANATSVSSLAENARVTISGVRKALADMRKHDKSATTGLKALGQELTSGIELLAEIGEITERSRLIAFNMAIEAARIGSQGNGFKVIVNELRNLNDQTGEFSKRVSELLGRFKKFNESLIEKTESGSSEVALEVERGIQEEEAAIESLLRVSTTCVDLSGNISNVVRSMNADLDGILESLQFQDITRQMVEGAQSMLADASRIIVQASSPDVSSIDDALVQMGFEEVRRELLSRSHTRGEKDAIQEVRA